MLMQWESLRAKVWRSWIKIYCLDLIILESCLWPGFDSKCHQFSQAVLVGNITCYCHPWSECFFHFYFKFSMKIKELIDDTWWTFLCKESRRISGLTDAFGLFCRCFPHLLIVGKQDQRPWEAVSSAGQVSRRWKSEIYVLVLWHILVESIKYFSAPHTFCTVSG